MTSPLSTPQPDSPFLPDTKLQFAWDSVSLGAFMSCPYKYKLQIIEGWRPKNENYAIALDFGILVHKALELYHVAIHQGADHEDAVRQTIRQITKHRRYANLPTERDIERKLEEFNIAAASENPDDDGVDLRNSKVRTRYHLMRAIVWYLEHYKDDPFKTLVVHEQPAVEVSFRVELPVELNQSPVLLCGHIDRAVSFNDYNYVTDFKTTKSITRQFFDSFTLSHQFSGYTYAGGVVFDQPIRGAFVDGIALQVGQVKFSRAPVDRTPSQIAEYMTTVQWIVDAAEEYHDTDRYPMNTQSCYFCEYKDVCRQPPEFRGGFLNTYFKREPAWNPLENR